jgi:hypothetical protein
MAFCHSAIINPVIICIESILMSLKYRILLTLKRTLLTLTATFKSTTDEVYKQNSRTNMLTYSCSTRVYSLHFTPRMLLAITKWIFRNGQPVCDDDRIIFATMTPKKKQRSLVSVNSVQNITVLDTRSLITYEV